MATFLLGALGVSVAKVSIKHLLKPRKTRVEKVNPPYEVLCASAIFSRLAYKDVDEFRSSAGELGEKYPSLRRTIDNIIFEKDEDLIFIDGGKKTRESHDENQDEAIKNEIKNDCQDTQVFTWIRNGHAYVVFRGTDSKNDVLANLDVRRMNFGEESGVLIHRGFLNQFNAIESDLTALLETHRQEYTQITFIGHSLGMACSTIASIFYEEFFSRGECVGPIIHCHGFGGPRVGNHKFAAYYAEHERLNKNTWQVKDFEDIVPMIPFSHRFCHVPSPTLCLYKGKVRYTNGKKDYPWFTRPFLILTKMNVFNISAAHNLDKYIQSLLKHYKKEIEVGKSRSL